MSVRSLDALIADYKVTRNGECDLCGQSDGRPLVIDHHHGCLCGTRCSKCVRGLLHVACNTAEGFARRLVSLGLMDAEGRIADYWEQPPFQQWAATATDTPTGTCGPLEPGGHWWWTETTSEGRFRYCERCRAKMAA